MDNKSPIFVTQPDLPPLEEFMPYLQQIWDSKVLTNGGPFHKQLEAELAEYLGVHFPSGSGVRYRRRLPCPKLRIISTSYTLFR